ncbi:MAG: uL15 family ribosomal protein [Candidatus ainarchaeum sp.]|nr:uL15 family ribosomal protein [Candidatus ainarchaeum sp.]
MGRMKKRTGKYRGTRSQGKGNIKNRGSRSCKGGRGQAGYGKHRKSWVVKYDKDHFGKMGFTRERKEMPVMNLYEIDNMIKNGKIKQEDGKYSYTFKGKLLGAGFISSPVSIKAVCWSKKAEEKIKKVSGEILNI